MKPRIFFLTLVVGAILLAACAPKATQPSAPQATQSPAQGVPVVAVTSRGDKLEATDPATVSLASGGVQLVEFFRFT